MKTYSRVCARVDLDAIAYNIEQMKQRVGDARMMAVIKTDGYGHGAVPIAHLLEPLDYIWGYAVATLEEAVILRKNGIEKPILILGCVFPDQYEEMLKYRISTNIYTEEMASGISALAEKIGTEAYMHIKIDTGMGRLGFPACEESVEVIERISRLPAVRMEGIFTHFARADETDKTSARKQLDAFCRMIDLLRARGVTFAYEHCANSAGIIDLPESHMRLVRAGISNYGMYPSDEVEKDAVDLRPALSLVSHVSFVKEVEAGTPISYGGTFVAPKKMKIATIPVGYGDGYPRSLSGKGYVLIRGKKAPILGRVCMDQFMVDVTEIPDVRFEDQVTLIGEDGGEKLPVEVLSKLSGRFNYEFVCDLGKRIPRVYVRNHEVTEQSDYFA